MNATPLYPLFLDLADKRVLVVGGGLVAERRVAALLSAGARVILVAPGATTELRRLSDTGLLEWLPRGFEPDDVSDCALVFTATGTAGVDDAVASAARSRGILVNAADDKENCDFHVPATCRRGAIQIAVATGGAAPALAAHLRNRLASSLAPEHEQLAALINEMRSLAQSTIAEPTERAAALTYAAKDPTLLAALARDARVKPEAALSAALSREPFQPPAPAHDTRAFVSLVGAGPGALDLLTVRAFDRIRRADVIVYDDLVDRRVLAEARPDAELVYSGTRGWRNGPTRPGPDLLVSRALEAGGKRVVRLKGGDPSIFGRAAEEIDALVAAGVPFEVVPGVTAALAAAAAAHMPLTRRAVSSSVTFVSAVGADDASTIDDVARLLDAGSTVAVYMGLRALPEIVGQLMASGVSGELPIAVICSASLPEENLTSGTLSDIEERLAANQADSGQPGAKPGLIVLGEVAAYAV